MAKFILLIVLGLYGFAFATYRGVGPLAEPPQALYLKQFENNDDVPRQIRADYQRRNSVIAATVLGSAATLLLAGWLLVQTRPWQVKLVDARGEFLMPKPSRSPEL